MLPPHLLPTLIRWPQNKIEVPETVPGTPVYPEPADKSFVKGASKGDDTGATEKVGIHPKEKKRAGKVEAIGADVMGLFRTGMNGAPCVRGAFEPVRILCRIGPKATLEDKGLRLDTAPNMPKMSPEATLLEESEFDLGPSAQNADMLPPRPFGTFNSATEAEDFFEKRLGDLQHRQQQRGQGHEDPQPASKKDQKLQDRLEAALADGDFDMRSPLGVRFYREHNVGGDKQKQLKNNTTFEANKNVSPRVGARDTEQVKGAARRAAVLPDRRPHHGRILALQSDLRSRRRRRRRTRGSISILPEVHEARRTMVLQGATTETGSE